MTLIEVLCNYKAEKLVLYITIIIFIQNITHKPFLI